MKTLQEVYESYSMPDCGGDKGTAHSYIDIYAEQIPAESGKSLLEVGVFEGHSIKMWMEYLPKSLIVGLDKDLSLVKWATLRYQVFKCDVTDAVQVQAVVNDLFDYIIDDGSHVYKDQVAGLHNLWGFLKVGGKYFIEDVASIDDAYRLADEVYRFTGCESKVYDLRDVKGRADDILIQVDKVK